jgi:hypothetical protein
VDELSGFGRTKNSNELGCDCVQQFIKLAMGFVYTNKIQDK